MAETTKNNLNESDLYDNLIQQKVKLENLFLNPNNPRIVTKNHTLVPDNRITEDTIQNTTVDRVQKEDLKSLMEKIKKVGFLPIDRIVVRTIKGNEGNYVVLEGNRRITSLKLMMKEHQKGIETLDDKILKSLEEVEVLIYTGKDPQVEWVLQGLRHINGIRQWGQFQQAKFLAEMVENHNYSVAELMRMTGLSRSNVNRLLMSMKAFDQARDIVGKDFDEGVFGVFYEAIFQKDQLKKYCGWDDKESKFKNEDNLTFIIEGFIAEEEQDKKFKGIRDIRDNFSRIVQEDNKDVLGKFVSEDNYSLDEAMADIIRKERDADNSREQLNLIHRIEEMKKLYTSLSTMPWHLIEEDDDVKNQLTSVVEDIEKSLKFAMKQLK